jgi:hypothetical protein
VSTQVSDPASLTATFVKKIRAGLPPEVAEGVYWHPVGAEDDDLLVTREIFPRAESFAAVRRAFDRDHSRRLASIFNCA